MNRPGRDHDAFQSARLSIEPAHVGAGVLMIKFTRLAGAGGSRPPHLGLRAIALGGLGGFLGIGVLALLGGSLGVMLLLGSFGASCVLLFGYPDAPFAQPLNVVGGHVICAVIGLAAVHWLGVNPWSLALAVGASIAAMMATRTVHPPAGSNPVIVFLSHPGWSFVVFPVLCGALLLVLIALLYNNVVRKTRYPVYW
jgi:CBS-domain-containing membrane protein